MSLILEQVRQERTNETCDQGDPFPSQRHRLRTYSLFDLISIGVGGTVGSGIFVLVGSIAHHHAGPATCVSFALSGVAAFCSGLCYAEWAGRLPVGGSTYVYAYVAMGELPAVLAGACLTLEYGVSGAAVARSWGDKVVVAWASTSADAADDTPSLFNPMAGLISLLSVVVLACGVQESKRVTNVLAVLKVMLVCFMVVGGFALFEAGHMVPFVPPALGAAGVLRGATSSFFGYLGFDEVCCLASEAKRPSDMPRAVLWTLAIVTTIYILASVSLTGMLDYTDISDTSGFPAAFAARGVTWASHLTAAGELATLPVVVLISLLAQPRLFAAMAEDGLLPAIFARVDNTGNLFWSNILCGIPMTVLATFVPFSWMDDAISVGILFAFNMTNTALILMKCSSSTNVNDIPGGAHHRTDDDDGADGDGGGARDGIIISDPSFQCSYFSWLGPTSLGRGKDSLSKHLLCYHVAALLAGLTSHLNHDSTGDDDENNKAGTVGTNNNATPWLVQIVSVAATILYAMYLHRRFPITGGFGNCRGMLPHSCHGSGGSDVRHPHENKRNHDGGGDDDVICPTAPFETPWVPFLPLLGVFLNWYLIAQLEWSGLMLLLAFLAGVSALYLACISGRRIIQQPPFIHGISTGRRYGDAPQYGPVASQEMVPTPRTETDGPILPREMSLPKR